MNDFERELTRMMRDNQQDTPLGQDDWARLRSGVRRRRRARATWMMAGSGLAVAVIGASTLVLSDAFATAGASSSGTAPSASRTTATPPAAGLIDALRHDMPSASGRVDPGTTAGSFVVTSPKGVKTYLGITVLTFNDPRLKANWSCQHAHDKDGGRSKTLGCTQLTVPGGSGWELSWATSPGLQANFVEYVAPYKNGWVSVIVENCNALRSCDTGSGEGVPAMTPTTAEPPLGMALLRRIGFDPDVISTAAKHETGPRGPGPSSTATNSAAPGSATPTTGVATSTGA